MRKHAAENAVSVARNAPKGAAATASSHAAARVLALQRSVGNAAVQRMLRPGRGAVHYTPEQAAEQLREGALAQHRTDREQLHDYVTRALTHPTDLRLRNSAQWVIRGTQGSKLYACTETHDARARADHHKRAGRRAVFSVPRGELYTNGTFDPTGVGYEADIASVRDIYFAGPYQAGGEASGHGILVIDVQRQPEAEFHRILRHEVQHAADFHPRIGPGDRPQEITEEVVREAWERYQTEFRAYSFDGGYKQYSTEKEVRPEQDPALTFTERQNEIFQHIYETYPQVTAVFDATDSSGKPAYPDFRANIQKFALPDSVNPINSIRIDAVFRALDLVPQPGYGRAAALERVIQEKVKELDPDDRQTLLNNSQSKLRLERQLDHKELVELNAAVRRGARAFPNPPEHFRQ